MRAAALCLVLALPAWGEEMPDAVGRISYGAVHRPGAALCTGTLVARDLVLTAAHCLRDVAPASVRFEAGLRDGVSMDRAQGRAVTFATGEGIAADVALLHLDRAMDGITPLSVREPVTPTLTRFAYSRDAPERLRRDDLCLVLNREGPLMRLGCGAVSGNSGAAVLFRDGEAWVIAGVMVARVGSGLGSIAVSVPADILRATAP